MKLTKLYNEFFESEKSGGILLICCTALSLLLANSFLQDSYLQLWHFQIGGHSSTHWINDGLMTIFFLLIGLELEREIYVGELSSLRTLHFQSLRLLVAWLCQQDCFCCSTSGHQHNQVLVFLWQQTSPLLSVYFRF